MTYVPTMRGFGQFLSVKRLIFKFIYINRIFFNKFVISLLRWMTIFRHGPQIPIRNEIEHIFICVFSVFS